MPNVRILIPTPLRQYAGNQNAVQVEAESVREALDDLVERHDQLRRHLFAEDGRLRNFVNVYVNEEDIRYLAQDGTSLKAGDTISLVPSIAGVGRRGIVDFDEIDESNLQRQVLYGTKDVGRKKLEVAKERAAQINPNVDVQAYDTRLTSDNTLDILKDYDVVIDGTDNF